MSLVGVQRAVMCWRQGGRGSLLPLLTLQPPLSLQMNPGPPPTPLHNTQVHHTLSIKHHSITPKYTIQYTLSDTTNFIWNYTTNLTTTTPQLRGTPHILSSTLLDTTHLYPIPSHRVQIMQPLTPDTNGKVREQCIPTFRWPEKYFKDSSIRCNKRFYIS